MEMAALGRYATHATPWPRENNAGVQNPLKVDHNVSPLAITIDDIFQYCGVTSLMLHRLAEGESQTIPLHTWTTTHSEPATPLHLQRKPRQSQKFSNDPWSLHRDVQVCSARQRRRNIVASRASFLKGCCAQNEVPAWILLERGRGVVTAGACLSTTQLQAFVRPAHSPTLCTLSAHASTPCLALWTIPVFHCCPPTASLLSLRPSPSAPESQHRTL